MTEPVKVTTTDDGVDVYVNEEGRFMANFGKCICATQGLIPATHGYYCRAKTITRKSMPDLLRELSKAAKPKVPVKVIRVSHLDEPELIDIIAIERDHNGFERYRGAGGNLSPGYAGENVRVYSEEAFTKLMDAYRAMVAARSAYEEVRRDHQLLPTVTREVFRDLAKQQQAGVPE